MKSIFSFLIICFLQSHAFSQKISLLTLEQLDARVNNGKDTVFVINFWATWCGPCVEELPNFEKLNRDYSSEKIKVILVSVDFKSKLKSALAPFVKLKKLQSEVFLLDEPDQQAFIDRVNKSWSGSIPATLFIKNGQRSFFEKEFTYTELVNTYKTRRS